MKHADRFLPVLLFLSLLAVYGLTLAPGLTWANRGADGGDLIAAAATGGVPHPTGYPVYLLLARLFQFLPIGSLAFRTNLMSALAAAAASLMVYGLVTRSLPSRNRLAGLVAAYAFGLSPLLWSQAVITEVYALHAFFVALILYWSVFPPSSNESKSDLALGLTFGLALGNHLTTILLLPVLLTSTLTRQSDSHFGSDCHFDARSLSRRLMGLGVGLLTYLILPLRALSHPPVNWGNPVTLKNFGWLVSARLYQDEVFALTLPSLWERIQSAAALLLDQFGMVGLIVSLVGLVFFFRPSPFYRNTIWIAAVFSIFAIGYATYDSFLYFIPPALCFAVWIGIGVDGLMAFVNSRVLPSLRGGWFSRRSNPQIARRDCFAKSARNDGLSGLFESSDDLQKMIARHVSKLGLAAGLAFLLYLFFLAGGHWPLVDASRDARAEQFGEMVMTQMPADTLVFVSGDQAIFSLWYFHYALHQRTDLAVIAADLLAFDWYQETLKAAYPSLVVPGPFPFPETILFANPGRPVCYVEYDGQALIQCP
jgi:hypothetical protein